MLDTDCNPDDVSLPIPANDDGIRSVEVIMRHVADAILAGNSELTGQKQGEEADKNQAAKIRGFDFAGGPLFLILPVGNVHSSHHFLLFGFGYRGSRIFRRR